MDGSADVIRNICMQDQNITGIILNQNYGQQCAVFCGLHYARADYTVIIDDDLEQDPADMMLLYEQMKNGYDAVYGINNSAGQRGIFRNIGSKIRDGLVARLTDLPEDMKVSSFRIMNRDTVDKILKADTRFVYISLEMLKYTTNIQNIFVDYHIKPTSNYRIFSLVRLLIRMYMYYAPKTALKRYQKKGPCYQVKKIYNEGVVS